MWDTGLAAHALMEAGGEASAPPVRAGLAWLEPLQITDVAGDWAVRKPHVRPGGWAFQYANAYYPDVDDTAVVAMAMDRAAGQGPDDRGSEYKTAIARAREWIEGLQSANGGWGAFDSDNDYDYLNYIPFADHGALLDPPTADVTARCLSMLGQLGEVPASNPAGRARRRLSPAHAGERRQLVRPLGNELHLWNLVCALRIECCAARSAKRGSAKSRCLAENYPEQRRRLGRRGESYALDYAGYCPAPSTPSQTAWALLGLMAAGVVEDNAVTLGVRYLARTQAEDGFWKEERFTATGFPRVFFLRYHGYAKYFPLWAMARYRNLKSGNRHPVLVGM